MGGWIYPHGRGTRPDVHLTAQWLTVSADTVYNRFQRGDVPGCKVGRKWLEQSAASRTTAAQDAALARAIAHGDTAALGDAVQTGTARLGTHVQPPTR